jgi:hypothetical protein
MGGGSGGTTYLEVSASDGEQHSGYMTVNPDSAGRGGGGGTGRGYDKFDEDDEDDELIDLPQPPTHTHPAYAQGDTGGDDDDLLQVNSLLSFKVQHSSFQNSAPPPIASSVFFPPPGSTHLFRGTEGQDVFT